MRILICGLALAALAAAQPVNNGNVNGQMAAGSRPGNSNIEIEAADDFILNDPGLSLSGLQSIPHATFTGLLTSGGVSSITSVTVEIYRVFPKDSVNPPSGSVPTRVNSPSDVAFDSRSSSNGTLTFVATPISSAFTAANSVLNGINKAPNQTTGGEGPVGGQEVLFDVTFTPAFDLPADHYFFVPQVEVTGGQFMWLSSVRPIVSPGIPFSPDLQAWIRNANLDPDWLRIGTDIVGGSPAPTFNLAFTLDPVAEASDTIFLSFFFN